MTNGTTYEDFKFSMPLNKEVEKFLKSKGYEKRSGTAAYPENRKNFIVMPFKKWYWEDCYQLDVHIEETIETKVVTKLVTTCK